MDPTFSAYSSSKVSSENCIKLFQKNHKGVFFSLRFSGFVEGGGIIKYIKDQALNNLPIKLYSKGNIYVSINSSYIDEYQDFNAYWIFKDHNQEVILSFKVTNKNFHRVLNELNLLKQ